MLYVFGVIENDLNLIKKKIGNSHAQVLTRAPGRTRLANQTSSWSVSSSDDAAS